MYISVAAHKYGQAINLTSGQWWPDDCVAPKHRRARADARIEH
jgi:hypothetical protein